MNWEKLDTMPEDVPVLVWYTYEAKEPLKYGQPALCIKRQNRGIVYYADEHFAPPYPRRWALVQVPAE